jgi:hypothetical protein
MSLECTGLFAQGKSPTIQYPNPRKWTAQKSGIPSTNQFAVDDAPLHQVRVVQSVGEIRDEAAVTLVGE